jgi:hypothetical protein
VGKPKPRPHEFEGFRAELEEYGFWHTDLEDLQATLQPLLFARDGCGPDRA